MGEEVHFATRTKVVSETYSLTWFWAGACCCWFLGPSLGGVLLGADIFAVGLFDFLLAVVLLLEGDL